MGLRGAMWLGGALGRGWSPGVGVEPWGGGVVVLHTCHVLCTYVVLMLYVCYYVSGHGMCTVYCAL